MRFGTYAEYMCVPEDWKVSLKPSNLTYEEAAAIPYGGMLSLHFLKKTGIQKGKNVLIYGASGAIGTSAVQLAKYYGANVTGVCSTANLEFVKSLGADRVIDTPNGKFISVDDGSPTPTMENLILLKTLAEANQIKPVIDRCYPLERIVEAHKYVETGHKKGNVAISISHDSIR